MASKFTDTDDQISEINVIPLVDIILVVLIIFMVTAPMIMKPSINVNLPKAASGEKTTPSELAITISSAGEFYVNGSLSNDEQLMSKATEAFSKNVDVQAIISADKDVSHGRVVNIMDIIKSVGIKKFAITIDRKE